MALSTTMKTDLYRFFAVAFDAAPGVTYMSQLADAANAGMSIQQIVEVFTTKPQFTSVYPNFFTNAQFADKLIETVVGDSATAEAKTEAKASVEAALNLGGEWTRGKVIYQVFNNLANKAADDAVWGGTSKMMANQIAYAQYYTEVAMGDTTDMAALRAVIANVTASSSTTTADMDAALSQGQTFMLTENVDSGASFIGTDANDLYVAKYTTTEIGERLNSLTPFDHIDGGDGVDTLHVTTIDIYDLVGAAAESVSVSNIENVSFDALSDLSVDLTGWTGVETVAVTSVAGDVSVDSAAANSVNVAATADVRVSDAQAQSFDITAGEDVIVVAGDASQVTIDAGSDASVTADNLGAVTIDAAGDVTVTSSEGIDSVVVNNVSDDQGDVSVFAAGDIGAVTVRNSDGNISIEGATVGDISITSNGILDSYDDLTIAAAGNDTVDLTVENVSYNIEVGSNVSDNAGATTLNLTVNGVASELYFSDAEQTSGSALETINIAGAADLNIGTDELSDSLTSIDAGDYTGNIELDAAVDALDLTIATGAGNDDIAVHGAANSDAAAISINAGEGDNHIDTSGLSHVDTAGVLQISAGAGSDEAEVNIQNLVVEGSSINLGGGDNTLTLHYNATLSEGDINAFDTLPVTGQIGTLNIASNVVLASDATLDVSTLDGEVHTITFSDVAVISDSDSVNLTIVGAATALTIQTDDAFGDTSDAEIITLNAVGVEILTLVTNDNSGDLGLAIDGSLVGSESLASLTVAGGDEIEVRVTNVTTIATVSVTSSDDVIDLIVTDSVLGDVTLNVLANSDDETQDIDIDLVGNVTIEDLLASSTSYSGNSDNTSSVYLHIGSDAEQITISSVMLTARSDAYLSISDTSGGVVDIDAVTLLAGDQAHLSVESNFDATITLSAVELTSVSDNADMAVANNDNTNITLGAITLSGDNTGLFVNNNDACDAAVVIDIGAVSQTSVYADADFNITDNDAFGNSGDLTIRVASVSLESEYDYASFEISGNSDDAVDGNVEIIVGNVSVSAGSDEDGRVNIINNDLSTITLGNVTVLAGSDADFTVNDNDGDNYIDRAYVTVGDVSVTSVYLREDVDATEVVVSGNDFATIDIGNVVVSAVSDAGVDIYYNYDSLVSMNDVTVTSSSSDAWFNLRNNYCDSTVEVGNVTLNAGEDAWFNIGDNGDGFDGDGRAIVGTVDITAASDATVYVGSNGEDYDVTLGDIDVVAGADIDFDLVNDGWDFAEIIGATNVTLTATAEEDGSSYVNVYMYEAADVATLTVNGSTDVSDSVTVDIQLDYVGDLGTIDLSGLGANSYTVLNLEEADADTLNAVTIKVGEGDLLAYVDDINDTVETFEFVGTDIGTIVIGGITTTYFDSNDYYEGWYDSIFNNFDTNQANHDVLDVTALGLTSSDLVLQLVDIGDDYGANEGGDWANNNDSTLVTFLSGSGVTGSILLIGVTNTDEVAESFLFAAA